MRYDLDYRVETLNWLNVAVSESWKRLWETKRVPGDEAAWCGEHYAFERFVIPERNKLRAEIAKVCEPWFDDSAFLPTASDWDRFDPAVGAPTSTASAHK